MTSYKLQVTSYKLQVTSYKLQVTSYELRVTSRQLQVTEQRRVRGVLGVGPAHRFVLVLVTCNLQLVTCNLKVRPAILDAVGRSERDLAASGLPYTLLQVKSYNLKA